MSTELQPFLLQSSENVRTPKFVEILLKMADDLEDLKKMAQECYGPVGNLYSLDSAATGIRSVAGQYLTRKPKNDVLEGKFEVILSRVDHENER